jgi:DNA-binding NtrC family response regulator
MAKILIVEDEEPILHSYAFVLKKKGHDVVTAENAEKGMKALKKDKFDLILLDLLMPEVSGLEFLEQTNPRKNFPETRVVVLTNTESPKVINDAMDRGASKYLLKVDNTPYTIADQIESFIRI